jgi:hypothetical protein
MDLVVTRLCPLCYRSAPARVVFERQFGFINEGGAWNFRELPPLRRFEILCHNDGSIEDCCAEGLILNR